MKKLIITDVIFGHLLENLTEHKDSNIESIAFVTKYRDYEFDFYAWKDENYKTKVQDFGKMKNGKWVQYEPTEKQLQVFKDYIAKRVKSYEPIETQNENLYWYEQK